MMLSMQGTAHNQEVSRKWGMDWGYMLRSSNNSGVYFTPLSFWVTASPSDCQHYCYLTPSAARCVMAAPTGWSVCQLVWPCRAEVNFLSHYPAELSLSEHCFRWSNLDLGFFFKSWGFVESNNLNLLDRYLLCSNILYICFNVISKW